MERFTKEIKGSISLFLSMIILLLVILEGFLIDGSRVLAGKMFLSSAGDLALNAGLTYYDEALRDIYGLFATCSTEEELTAALKVHFQQTLGEAVGSADEGYVDQLLGYIDTAIQSGWDGEGAGKLLNLATEDFTARGVGNSTLAETYVIRNQILEYMKYRGPASLGYGMIEKIYAFKDLDKQQKTIEAKLDYEETMSDVQEACEKAYESIEPYNQLLETSLKPETVEEESYIINRSMYEAIVAVWCYSVVKRDPEIETNWQVRKNTNKGDHNVPAAISACRLMPSMSALYDQVAAELEEEAFDTHPSASMKAVKIILGYKEEYENYCRLFTTWKNYLDYYTEEMERLEEELDNLDDDEDGDDIQEEIDALEEEKEDYEERYLACEKAINQFRDVLNPVRAILEADIDQRMQTAAAKINKLARDAEALRMFGEEGKNRLDDVLNVMDSLAGKGQTWQSAINNLSSGEVKTSMQSDYNNKSEMLDREKIHILQEKLANGISYGEMLKTAAQQTKAVDYILFEAEKDTYYPYMKARFEGTAYGNETLPYNGTTYNTFSAAAWVGNANHTEALTDSGCTVYFNSPNGEKKEGPIVKMDLAVYTSQMDDSISARTDEFFKYLERVCPKSEAEKAEADNAKEQKKKLLEEAKKISFSPDESLPSLSSAGGEVSSPNFDETNGDANDKDVSKNAKNNTKASSGFLSDVGSLLAKGRDKLYISEYATQMFSYYTVDKPKDSQGHDPAVKETLSGYPFTKEHNQMYKAEVEYILWGNPSGDADVQYTLTTIFGIRFLLNSIYAFTGDPEIRQISMALAVSIAGWTGFGVPLVQSVIIIGFALAETALDLKALKDGEDVPIYKSTSSWQIKPSALTKDVIGQAINDAGSAAKNFIYDQMDQLTESTKENFRAKLTEFSNETVSNLVSTATATVMTPVQERLIGIVNVVSPDSGKIRTDIQEAVSGVKSMIASEPDSIAKTIKLEAVSLFESRMLGKMVSAIQSVQNQDGLSNQEITEKINREMEDCRRNLENALQSTARELVDAECAQVNSALDSANEELQEKTSEAFDKMLMRIDCGVSFADLSHVDLDGGKGRTSGSAALTMNYKEYLWLFIAVKSIQNEDDMLQRIGTLIEANLSQSETKPSPGFKINSAYTFIEIDANVDISTTFFALPVPQTGGGSVTLGQDKYTIGYRGVLGY